MGAGRTSVLQAAAALLLLLLSGIPSLLAQVDSSGVSSTSDNKLLCMAEMVSDIENRCVCGGWTSGHGEFLRD